MLFLKVELITGKFELDKLHGRRVCAWAGGYVRSGLEFEDKNDVDVR